jgi:hypothetical protein
MLALAFYLADVLADDASYRSRCGGTGIGSITGAAIGAVIRAVIGALAGAVIGAAS